MCGCDKNVRFIKSSDVVQEQFTVPAPVRKLMQSCDTRGNCGRIETNDFSTSEKAQVRFNRQGQSNPSFPKEAFNVSLPNGSILLSAIGLRQLTEEFASMADELDGQKTVVAFASDLKLKPVRKVKKNSKSKKIVVKVKK